MYSIYHYPRNISMRWLKRFCSYGHLHLIVLAFSWVSAVGKCIPHHFIFSCAFFSLSHPVCCVSLQANDKRQSLSVVVVHLQSTRLFRIQDTLNGTMLTCENHTLLLLNSLSITIRKKFKVTNFPKILR